MSVQKFGWRVYSIPSSDECTGRAKNPVHFLILTVKGVCLIKTPAQKQDIGHTNHMEKFNRKKGGEL